MEFGFLESVYRPETASFVPGRLLLCYPVKLTGLCQSQKRRQVKVGWHVHRSPRRGDDPQLLNMNLSLFQLIISRNFPTGV